MEISRITSKGQITIPVDIRKKLNLKTGMTNVFERVTTNHTLVLCSQIASVSPRRG
jgi:AbrB family looped-hinge helix DNA binding protein